MTEIDGKSRLYIQMKNVPLATDISSRQAREWAAQGRLRVFRPTKRLSLVRWDDLVALIEGQRQAEDAAQPACASA